MKAVPNVPAALVFVEACTGLQLNEHDVARVLPGKIELQIPRKEEPAWVRKNIVSRLGDSSYKTINYPSGVCRLVWQFSDTRLLVFVQFMREKGRANPASFIHLIDNEKV